MSEKMHLPLITINIKVQESVKQSQVIAPYIFTINDIIGTDWVIVVPETD